MRETSGWTFFPLRTLATSTRSSYRPFVQAPTKASVIRSEATGGRSGPGWAWLFFIISGIRENGTALAGLWGKATMGSRADRSTTIRLANAASGSLARGSTGHWARPFR